MWQRHGPCALGVLAILIGGCNKSDGPTQSGATPAPNDPVQMNISGQQPVLLGPDNIEAEISKAGSGVKLVKLDLSPAGLPLTMDAPEGAKVQKDNLNVQVVAEDRFAISFKLGKRPFQWKKQKLGGQKILVNAPELILSESTLLLAARCEFGKHVVVGHQDYCIENIDPVFGRQVNHSEADCLLMLKCIGTLAPKTPLSSDPLAALQQFNARIVKGADGQATGLTLDPHQTSDAMLELVAKVSGLERLDLHQCPITDEGLAHLGGLTSLKELNLSDCDFTDAGLSSLARLTNLQLLNLASSFGDSPQIKGTGLAALSGLTKLQVLVLDKNLVDDAALTHLKNLKGLKELYLEQTTRITGSGLANLAELPGLTMLSLNETKITDAGLDALKDVSNLEVLNLRGTLVRGSGIKSLHGLKKLHTLNLGNTPLSDVELPKLAGLPGLKRLILEGAEVSDGGMEYLQGVKTLKQVALSRTKVTKAGADKLKAALPGVEVTLD
jgi:Leucine-rich repeat (LRR) protein